MSKKEFSKIIVNSRERTLEYDAIIRKLSQSIKMTTHSDKEYLFGDTVVDDDFDEEWEQQQRTRTKIKNRVIF